MSEEIQAPVVPPQAPRIGVALSGGGHRAALFGLGVLMYLHEAGKHVHVNCISSVSGGSLTNGVVGQQCCFPRSTNAEFDAVVRNLANTIAQKGTLFRPIGTWLYLMALALTFVASIGLIWLNPRWFGFLLFMIAIAAWARYLLGARGWVCARAFGATLFNSQINSSLLTALAHPEIDHVLCATELHCAEHIYFSGSFVYSYRLGNGLPGNMKLQDAAQASAAFPGGFPPRWFRAVRFRFQNGGAQPTFVVASDGGVYDNMAEQWITGAEKRLHRQGVPKFQVCDTIVLVNSSISINWAPIWTFAVPLLGEWTSFKRVIDALYDNTTAQRRSSLAAGFFRGDGLRGAFVTIEQTPFSVAQQLANDNSDAERASRAHAVLERFGETEAHWREVAADNQKIPTTLRSLGKKKSADLIYHAYALASANLHVILNFPLLEPPNQAHFEKLLMH